MNRTINSSLFIKAVNPAEVLPMKMLYFSSLEPESVKQLDELIESYVPDNALEKCWNLESLSERLSRPMDNVAVVLMATEKETLMKLVTLQTELHKLRLVVILPDKDQETAALCNKLHPRFLSYTFGNFSVVKAILKKMFSNSTPTVSTKPTHGSQSHTNSQREQKAVLTQVELEN